MKCSNLPAALFLSFLPVKWFHIFLLLALLFEHFLKENSNGYLFVYGYQI